MRVRMWVAYDGTDFHGFAVNNGVRTVAGELTAAIERVVGAPVELSCAGRTDKGVHARGQVVSFDVPDDTDAGSLAHRVTAMVGPEVVLSGAQVVDADFDARFSARWRRYRYTVLNRPDPDPFLARTAWHVAAPLDRRALVLACDPLIGEHDFSSFCRRPKTEDPSLVRRVLDAGWREPEAGLLEFEIRATAFCHQMVRSIVGLLVDVGRGRKKAGEVSGIIRARDRSATSGPAPAHGLCLIEVGYP